MRQHRRGHQGGVLDTHTVVDLVALAQAAQDRDRLFYAGLIDEDRLEAALQGAVFLDILAVLIERGGADAVQLAAGKQRLEQVRRIHGALGRARTDHGVEFIDEQDDLTLGLLDLFEHRLEPLFELTPELGAGNQRAHVEHNEPFVLQTLRHVPTHDALGEPFDDRGLAYARVSDQDRVVFGAAREHLDHPPDLVIATDDRVELALGGEFGEVATVALQGLIGRLWVGARHSLVSPHLLQGGH